MTVGVYTNSRATQTVSLLLCVLLAAVMITGCERQETPDEGQEPPPVPAQEGIAEPDAPDTEAEEDEQADAVDEQGEDTGEETGNMTVIEMHTSKGTITARLFDEKAPITAGNFLLLVEDGFYDGLTFHRVEPGFVIQGGDPEGTGAGGPGFSIPLEVSPDVKHERGTLSMARTPFDLDSGGSQFFICLDRETARHLDQQYSAFGEVIEGMDVVDRIEKGDIIEKAEVVSESPHADEARAAARAARVPD